jgi:hypothetical protein
MVKEYYDENKVKIAFSNVKNDILDLKKEIESIKSELREIKEKMSLKKEVSKGNKGVVISSLYHRYDNVMTTQHEISSKRINEDLEILDSNIKKFILSLSDREFLIFISIYQIEDELNRPVTYNDLFKRLNLSSFSLRNGMGELFRKDAPIIKERLHNSVVSFSINKDFRALKIGDKIIDFRRSFENQTKLSDIIDI